MVKLEALRLSPGEIVSVDSVRGDVARLVIGKDGDRVETVCANQLPADGRAEGVTLRVRQDGRLERDPGLAEKAKAEVASVMDDVFGGPPPG